MQVSIIDVVEVWLHKTAEVIYLSEQICELCLCVDLHQASNVSAKCWGQVRSLQLKYESPFLPLRNPDVSLIGLAGYCSCPSADSLIWFQDINTPLQQTHRVTACSSKDLFMLTFLLLKLEAVWMFKAPDRKSLILSFSTWRSTLIISPVLLGRDAAWHREKWCLPSPTFSFSFKRWQVISSEPGTKWSSLLHTFPF